MDNHRFVPKRVKPALEAANVEQVERLTPHLNALTRYIQKRQRESGRLRVAYKADT